MDMLATDTDSLSEALLDGAVAVCVKDGDGRVLTQDLRCRRICGERIGRICTDGCMALFAADHDRQWRDWGSSVYGNSTIHGALFDVTMICGPHRITTFLQPLEDRYHGALAHYTRAGLTPREEEVLALILRGETNTGIGASLGISRATLRTHLNRIYTKLRQRGMSTEFLPGYRTRDKLLARPPAAAQPATTTTA
ncbi:MAG: hypothetical protein CALGDGBN_01793 [Pseudomonadales bacterium]|nr:hypothetical protein [Pseudomonadales bacterium]